jgi:diacylglycerol kinase (ATP)
VSAKLDPTALVIWNPSAGSTESSEALKQALIEDPRVELLETDSREAAFDEIERAIAQDGVRRIIAAGGDGTVNTVLQAVKDAPGVSAGILPLGTGNDFARNLGIPLDLPEALEIALGNRVHPIDLMHARWEDGERLVVNMCTAGNTGLFMEQLTPEMKRRWGPFCYLRGVVDVIVDMHVFDVEITFDDDPPRRFETLNLFIANGSSTGAGMTVAPTAELDDGLLDVVLVQDGTAAEVAELTAEYILTDFLENPLIVHRRARRVEVRAEPPMKFSMDGDLVTEGDVVIEVLPGCVEVAAPGRERGE